MNVEIFLHSSYSVEHMGADNFDMFVLLKLGLYGFNLFQDGKQKVQCSWSYLVFNPKLLSLNKTNLENLSFLVKLTYVTSD